MEAVPSEVLCADCDMYDRGYAAGLEAGREEMGSMKDERAILRTDRLGCIDCRELKKLLAFGEARRIELAKRVEALEAELATHVDDVSP